MNEQENQPKENRRGGMRGLIEAAALLILISGALATLAGWAAQLWWPCELATHFRFQYMLAFWVAALPMACFKRWKWATFATLGAAFHLAAIAPLSFDHQVQKNFEKRSARGGEPLRILSANVNSANRKVDLLLKLIQEEEPDLVLVMELSPRWATDLESIKKAYPYQCVHPQNNNFGIALYSRYPLSEIRTHDLLGVPAIEAKVSAEGGMITFIGAHPVPPVSARMAARRNAQVERVASAAKAIEGPVVVAGDFNITSWSPYFRDLLKNGGLRDSRHGFGIQSSWPTSNRLMRIPIDHILISKEIQIIDRRIGPNLGSDHLPVLVDISVR